MKIFSTLFATLIAIFSNLKSKMTKGAMSLGALAGIFVTFVVITIIGSFGGEVLSQIQGDQTAQGYAYNITGYGLSGINTMASWLPTLAVIIIASIVIGIMYLYFQFGGNQ